MTSTPRGAAWGQAGAGAASAIHRAPRIAARDPRQDTARSSKGAARLASAYHRYPDAWARERQRGRLGLDGLALWTGETTPRLDRQDRSRAAPRAGDVAVDEQCARPDARRPQAAALFRVLDEQRPIAGALEEEPGIAARQESRPRRVAG